MKYLKRLCLLLVSILVLTACNSGSNNEPNKEGASKENSGKTVLRLAMWDKNQEEVLKEIADNYTKEHPDVEVQIELSTFKDHFTKLETQAQGNVMPDIFFMNGPRFIKFASNDLIEPLDNMIAEKNIDLKVFPEALVNLYTYEGKLLGMPKDWDLTGLWYNKEIFDNANEPYPTEDRTWEDMTAAAERLTDKDAGIWGLSAKPDTQESLYDTIPQSGGFIINEEKTKSGYDTPEALEGTQRWVELLEKGISPSLEVQTDTKDVELFKAGKLAMIYSATWNIPEYMNNENINSKIDVQIMPLIKKRAATIHGLSYCVAKGSENKEQALEFIAYLASDEVNDLWAEKATVIPANQNSLDKWVKAYPDINLQAFLDELEYSVMYPTSKDTAVWNQYETEAINQIFSLQEPAKEGLDNLAKKMDEALSNEK